MLKLRHARHMLLKTWPAAFRRLCVETRKNPTAPTPFANQPPLGGCVLKPARLPRGERPRSQPPLGGCVLKPTRSSGSKMPENPAAFRRLCVETSIKAVTNSDPIPAAFRRLCVETSRFVRVYEKGKPSRLRAAVC